MARLANPFKQYWKDKDNVKITESAQSGREAAQKSGQNKGVQAQTKKNEAVINKLKKATSYSPEKFLPTTTNKFTYEPKPNITIPSLKQPKVTTTSPKAYEKPKTSASVGEVALKAFEMIDRPRQAIMAAEQTKQLNKKNNIAVVNTPKTFKNSDITSLIPKSNSKPRYSGEDEAKAFLEGLTGKRKTTGLEGAGFTKEDLEIIRARSPVLGAKVPSQVPLFGGANISDLVIEGVMDPLNIVLPGVGVAAKTGMKAVKYAGKTGKAIKLMEKAEKAATKELAEKATENAVKKISPYVDDAILKNPSMVERSNALNPNKFGDIFTEAEMSIDAERKGVLNNLSSRQKVSGKTVMAEKLARQAAEKVETPIKPIENQINNVPIGSNLSNVSNQPKQPWQMTKSEHAEYLGLNDAPKSENYMNLSGKVGERVSAKYGTQDIPTLVNQYKQKYNLPDINVSYRDYTSKKAGTTPKYDGNGNVVGATIRIDPTLPQAQKVGILRHELEHVKDLSEGYHGTNASMKDVPNYKTLGEGLAEKKAGHHKNYGVFESEYLHKNTIKDAIRRGETIPDNVMDEYPELKNIKPTPKKVVIKQEPKQVEKPNIVNQAYKEIHESEVKQSTQQSKYTPEQEKALAKLEAEYKDLKESSGMFGDDTTRSKAMRGTAERYSAKKREIIQGDSLKPVEGGLTAKELDAKISREKSNYIGKKVVTPDGEGTIAKNSFGKVGVKLENGDVKYFESDKVTPKITEQLKKTSIPEQPNKVTLTQEHKKTNTSNVSDITKIYKPAQRVEAKGTLTETGFTKNVATDKNMNSNLVKHFSENKTFHNAMTNKDTLASAQKRFGKGYDKALKEFQESDWLQPDDIPLSRMLANEAAKRGDMATATAIVNKASDKLLEAGRLSQAAKIMRKSEPSVMHDYLLRTVDRLNNEGRMKYGGKWKEVNLSEQLQKEIYNFETFDEKAAETIKERARKELGDQLPTTIVEKFDGWRRIAMLLNPKTHIRNIAGNWIMMSQRKIADSIGAIMENAIPIEQRTKSIGWSMDKDLKDIVDKSWAERKNGIVSGSGRYDIERLKVSGKEVRLYKNNFLEAINNVSKKTLEAEDVFFLKRAYKDALGGFLKARGTKEITQEAIDYATRRAQEATYRQANKLSQAIETLKKRPIAGKAVDIVVPFSKTPANIMETAIDYSPIGIAKTFYNIGTKKGAATAIESLAKGLTGSGTFALGVLMANMGWSQGALSTNKKVAALTQEEGGQPNSIKTPFGNYTIDWAQPWAIPFVMGVSAAEADSKNTDNLMKLVDMGKADLESFISMTMLKGIRDFMDPNKGSLPDKLVGLPLDYLLQGLPTLSGQIARIMDNTKRSTYSDNSTDNILNQFKSRIPGLSKSLEPKVDIFGNDMKQGGAIEQFASPGFYSKYKNDPVAKEIVRIADKFDTSVIPAIAPKKFSVSQHYTENKSYPASDITLKPKEITKYQRTMGKANYADIKQLIADPAYKALTDEEKKTALAKIVSTNTAKAKDMILDDRKLSIDMTKSQIKDEKKKTSKNKKSSNKSVNELMKSIFE